MQTSIRIFDHGDILDITHAFQAIGWDKPASQYERYWLQQQSQLRSVYVAFVREEFAGYLTICWRSTYEPFRVANIPEITDFNVLPKFRRMGIGTQLMDRAEAEISTVHLTAGIGVGMTADYGAAQQLYVRRGYIPDGRGLRWRNQPVRYGDELRVDDDLVLYLTKDLK